MGRIWRDPLLWSAAASLLAGSLPAALGVQLRVSREAAAALSATDLHLLQTPDIAAVSLVEEGLSRRRGRRKDLWAQGRPVGSIRHTNQSNSPPPEEGESTGGPLGKPSGAKGGGKPRFVFEEGPGGGKGGPQRPLPALPFETSPGPPSSEGIYETFGGEGFGGPEGPWGKEESGAEGGSGDAGLSMTGLKAALPTGDNDEGGSEGAGQGLPRNILVKKKRLPPQKPQRDTSLGSPSPRLPRVPRQPPRRAGRGPVTTGDDGAPPQGPAESEEGGSGPLGGDGDEGDGGEEAGAAGGPMMGAGSRPRRRSRSRSPSPMRGPPRRPVPAPRRHAPGGFPFPRASATPGGGASGKEPALPPSESPDPELSPEQPSLPLSGDEDDDSDDDGPPDWTPPPPPPQGRVETPPE